MIAQLEDNYYNLYNDNKFLSGTLLIVSKSGLEKDKISVGDKNFEVIREKRKLSIYENERLVYDLVINPFSGTILNLQTKQKIKGVFGLKWGTQLVDKNNQTLLKIRNESLLEDVGTYIIETSVAEVSELDILISLWAHLYGSKQKQRLTLILVIPIVFLVVQIRQTMF